MAKVLVVGKGKEKVRIWNAENNSVSVIIPVYNSEKYIAETIESICKQTYDDFEVILVDDESSDGSIDTAKELLQRNEIKYSIIRQGNKGLSGARNTGLKHATGEYVCFIDSDDIISASHITELVSIIKQGRLDIAFSMFEYTKEANRNGKIKSQREPEIMSKEDFLYHFVRRRPAVHCCSLMIRTSFLKNNNLEFNETLRKYGEDVEFMWRLFPNTDRIGCTGNSTYKYLVRNGSLMTVGRTEPWDVFLKEFISTIKNELARHPDLSKYYLWAYYRTMIGLLRSIAESTEYAVFKTYADRLVTAKMINTMKSFPDFKIRFMAMLLKNQKRIYYTLFRKRVRFYNESRILNRV